MVRQKDVRGAYAKVGNPTVLRESSGAPGRVYIAMGFAMVAILFLSLGRNTSKSKVVNDDNRLSGQAHHAGAGDAMMMGSTAGVVDSTFSSYTSPSASENEAYNPSAQKYEGESNDVTTQNYNGFDQNSNSEGMSGAMSRTSSFGKEDAKSGDDYGDDSEEEDEEEESEEEDESESSRGSDSGDDEEDNEKDQRLPSSTGYSYGGGGGSSNSGYSNSGAANSGTSGYQSSYSSSGYGNAAGSSAGTSSSYNSGNQDYNNNNGGDGNSDADAAGGQGGSDGNNADEDESSVDKAEEQIIQDLRQAEQEEVKQEEAKVESTVGKFGGALRIGLGRLFGDKVSTEEIEEIAETVEVEVKTAVDSELELESTAVLNEALEHVNEEILDAEEQGKEEVEIVQELVEEETVELDTMRHSMQEIENRVEENIKTRTQVIEKKILEDRLSKKLGREVKLTFLDNAEEREFGGLDEVLKDLPSLRRPAPAQKKRKKHKKSSFRSGGN